MKILVLGTGLMGPAAAYNAMSSTGVSQVGIADIEPKRLDACMHQLSRFEGAAKLKVAQVDVTDLLQTAGLMSQYDVVVGTLPQSIHTHGIRAAAKASIPLVDAAYFDHTQWQELKQEVNAAGVLVIAGCGVEPGLTEVMSRHLAERLDRADALHIKVGGIPEQPTAPLGYKIVFGGRLMPWKEDDATILRDGRLQRVPRFSGVETISAKGVGKCEAWHEGFLPWMLEVPSLKSLRTGTQKTIRWPGYARSATTLLKLGLLSMEPVVVDGVEVVPKRLVDEVLFPFVKMEAEERDITIFRVELLGQKNGQPLKYRADMVDRFDKQGFTSMARTTAMTAAIVARMIARGEIVASGLVSPEKILSGPLFENLLQELSMVNIIFDISEEKIG